MRIILLVFSLATALLEGALIPSPFLMHFQRVGRDSTLTYFGKKLFYDCYGIAMVKPRGTNSTFLIVSDPDWCRLIYTRVYEQSEDFEYLRQFGGYGSTSDKFIVPKGLCIDTTVYSGNSDEHTIYVADSRNNRISKLKYSITQDKILADGIFVSGLNNPTDVACASRTDGGAYIVVVEKDANRIRLYERNAGGAGSLIQNYGTQGPGQGQFFQPNGVSVCLATDTVGGYFIYVTDTGNRRIVCLRYKTGEEITWTSAYKTLEIAHFLSVTASQYYCVYVTDFLQNKIWVFTPGLGELLYTYGNSSLLNGPKDVYMDWDRIGLTERWTATTGLQYFKIIPEIREFYPLNDNFDATVDSCRFTYKVVETHGYLTMKIEGQTIFANQYHAPGSYISPWWNGRDGSGKVVVPGLHKAFIQSAEHINGVANVNVKGTKVADRISNLHWSPAGNPYVLVGASYVDVSDTLFIEPNVLIMGHDEYSSLNINGALMAIGNMTDSIIFTSHRKLRPVEDSTYPGMWDGIYIPGRNPATRLNYCQIEYTDTPIFFNADSVQQDFIKNSLIKDNINAGQCFFWSAGSFDFGNKYSNNLFNKIQVWPGYYEDSRILDSLIIKKQEVPYLFRRPPRVRQFGYTVYGDSDYAAVFKITPGTRLEFEEEVGLSIGMENKRALVDWQGLVDDSIKLVAADSVFGWAGISFSNETSVSDSSVIVYTDIENTNWHWPAITLGDSTTIEIRNSRFAGCKNYAIEMVGTNPYNNILIKDCAFIRDSIPVISSLSNINGLQTCTFANNKQDIIQVVADRVHKDITIHRQGIPYLFLNTEEYGNRFELYGIDTVFSLTINPGVEIICDTGVVIAIGDSLVNHRARLIIEGNDTDLVYLHSLNPGDLWQGIMLSSFEPRDTSVIEWTKISQANRGLSVNRCDAVLKNTSITNCDTGISIIGDGSLMVDSSMINLNRIGVCKGEIGSTAIRISSSSFSGNRLAVMNEQIGNIIDADSNWWGDGTGPWDPSSGAPDYNPSGRGDSIGDYVIYRPWLTSPVQPPRVTLIQPNGGETLYCGQSYEIKWRIGDKEMWRQEDREIKGIRISGYQDIRDKYEIRDTKSETSSNDQILNRIRDEILKRPMKQPREQVQGDIVQDRVQNDTLTPILSLQGRGGKGQSQILRQELYYTTDFPEGGAKGEVFWKFIDTVPVGETTYTWRVPNTPSSRCRVGIKIYYETGRQGDKEKGIGLSGNQDIRIKSQIPNPKSQTISNNQISNIKITATLSHSSRDLTFDFPLLTSDSCAISVDISDGNWTIALATDFALSTAYNQGRKILTSPTGNKVHFVYANEGLTLPSGIFYCSSQDSGKTFEIPEMVDSSGLYPAMSLDPYGNPCASWVSGSNIYFTYWTSSWAPPDTIVLPVENVSPPSMVCDNRDTIHLVYVQYYYLPPIAGDLIYLKFKRTNFTAALCETLLTSNFCRTPSIALDEKRAVHILWQGQNCICYWQKDSTGVWGGIDTIYITPTNEWLYPVIDVYGNKVVGVWQDRDVLSNFEIFSRRRIDTGWEEMKKVAQTSGDSKFPVLANAHYCLWQDNSAGNWEVYKSDYIDTAGTWLEPENLSNTLTQSSFPHCAYALVNANTAKLYSLWTEGDTIPYEIKFKRLDVSPVAKIFADLGQPIQSSYCLNRDGYWVFGDKPYQTVDWGYNNLQYKFTGLDPEKISRMDLAYYFKNNPQSNPGIETGIDSPLSSSIDKGIGRIIQVLVVDGIPLDTVFITPNRLIRRSVWLPKEIYADGEMVVKIRKIKGKRVVCSEVGLYEFPEDKKEKRDYSGPMGEEELITRPFLFEKIYPNPVRDILKIRFYSPNNRWVRIRMYDVLGRLVLKEDLPQTEIGENEVLVVLKNLACGVYFMKLESEGHRIIKKVILLK